MDIKCVTCNRIVYDSAERQCAIVQCDVCKRVPLLFHKGRREMIDHMFKVHDCNLHGLDNATQ